MVTIEELETRVAALERQARKAKKANRKKHEYTEEERANIRARLLAGQEAARKKREAEVKATKKVRPGNTERAKASEAGKPVEA